MVQLKGSSPLNRLHLNKCHTDLGSQNALSSLVPCAERLPLLTVLYLVSFSIFILLTLIYASTST